MSEAGSARPPNPNAWQCDLGGGKYDHDWEFIPDWYGDPEVVGGTADCSFWRCRACGEETATDPHAAAP